MKIKISYFFLLLLLSSCGFIGKKNLQNSAYLYQEKIAKINAEYQLYHKSNTESTLYCKIKSSELLSIFSSSEKQNKISFLLSGKLFVAEDETTAIDSFAIERSMLDTTKWIRECFTFSAHLHEHYLLKITLKDLNKAAAVNKSIYFEKEAESKENFQIFKEQEKQYGNTFNLGDTILISYNTDKKIYLFVFLMKTLMLLPHHLI